MTLITLLSEAELDKLTIKTADGFPFKLGMTVYQSNGDTLETSPEKHGIRNDKGFGVRLNFRGYPSGIPISFLWANNENRRKYFQELQSLNDQLNKLRDEFHFREHELKKQIEALDHSREHNL